MDFDKFENSNFFKSAKIRINPVTMEHIDHYLPVLEYRASDCFTKIDPVNNNEVLDELHINLHSVIRMTLPNSEVWITEEFRNEIYRQLAEVQGLVEQLLEHYYKNNSTKDKQIQIIRNSLVMTKPGLSVHRHNHGCPMTITFCYKFDNNAIANNEPSHLSLGHYDNKIKAYLPDNDKFYFVMKNSPVHGASTNEWRFWWTCDFTELFDIPELPFPKWEHKYLDNNSNL
jgi:hypothetical protein